MLILLFMKLPDTLNLKEWSPIRRINVPIRLKGEKSWLFGELDFEKQKVIRKIAQEVAKQLKNYREFAGQKLKEPRQLKYDEFSTQQKENTSTVNQLLVSDSGIARQCEFLERCTRIR